MMYVKTRETIEQSMFKNLLVAAPLCHEPLSLCHLVKKDEMLRRE